MGKIAFTTTVPVEIILAAGKTPVDLNNVFINSPDAARMVDEAEEAGFPRNMCGWIKGLYTVADRISDLEAVIAVTQGDCSNTQALMETLILKGKRVIPFAFPFDRDYDLLAAELEHLRESLGADREEMKRVKERLDGIREKLAELDRLTWEDNLVTGGENHVWLVSASDFNGDPEAFARELGGFLLKARQRRPLAQPVRLAYIGVPPIVTDLYDFLEKSGARVVFNEVQRQFAMPYLESDLVEQYRRYTYPYGAFARLEDIAVEIERREVNGVIHYTQSFCFRQIEDIIFRQRLKLPILTLEGERPGKLDARSRMRVEAFVDMLR